MLPPPNPHQNELLKSPLRLKYTHSIYFQNKAISGSVQTVEQKATIF